jgi:hypothetical protein
MRRAVTEQFGVFSAALKRSSKWNIIRGNLDRKSISLEGQLVWNFRPVGGMYNGVRIAFGR